MRLRKRGLVLVFLLLISFLIVSCAEDTSNSDSFDFQDVVDKVIWVGQLNFLGDDGESFIGFIRILVAILVFAIIFELLNFIEILGKNTAIVIAAIIAIISAMFIPGEILASIGAAYGAVVAFVLIGIPVLGGGYALYRIPSEHKWQILLKMAIIALLIWILMAVKTHARSLAGL